MSDADDRLKALFAADAPPARDPAFVLEVAHRMQQRRLWLELIGRVPWGDRGVGHPLGDDALAPVGQPSGGDAAGHGRPGGGRRHRRASPGQPPLPRVLTPAFRPCSPHDQGYGDLTQSFASERPRESLLIHETNNSAAADALEEISRWVEM